MIKDLIMNKTFLYMFFTNLGILCGILIFIMGALKQKMDKRTLLIILSACILGSALGSKIPIWFYYYKKLLPKLSDIRILLSGRTIAGGIIGGWIFIELAKKIFKIRIKTGDLFAPGIALGMAIGRIGCYLGGCCYGIETQLPWAHDFGDHVFRHPVQLYSSVFDFLLFLWLWYKKDKIKKEGDLFKSFLIYYFSFRFCIEFIRTSPRIFFNLTGFQITSIIVLSYLLITRTYRRKAIEKKAEKPQ